MKTLKRILTSTILILAMAFPLYAGAGDVNMPAAPIPPPPATCSDCETSGVTPIEPSDTTLSAKTKSFEESDFAVDLMLTVLSFF